MGVESHFENKASAQELGTPVTLAKFRTQTSEVKCANHKATAYLPPNF